MSAMAQIIIVILCIVGAYLPLYFGYKLAKKRGEKLHHSEDAIAQVALCYFTVFLAPYIVLWILIIAFIKEVIL